ncbi:hypothetical protein GI374_13425 [Paracoccus sp. S-4012]|uniref:hypothetical protein n=1 Tax=Paracoccus sp. S-4012 TaxID=2665648 RepID=UPI0012B0380B|nr:hypothetical protein [Paracoccus sp. S-4012]MRX51425.1 hypothetical protein [Paracoccus sp. S-4012]
MTRPNRVGPDGSFSTAPARGTLMGNRGVLHDERGAWTGRKWAHWNWVSCALGFNGRKRHINAPGRYTELFFYDEAVSFAAGHRPCATCRRDRYREVTVRYHRLHGTSSPAEIDAHLNVSRCRRGGHQLRREAEAKTLPAGCFVWRDARILLILRDVALPYGPDGYGPPEVRPEGPITILTPWPLISLFADGLSPELHPSVAAMV